MDQEHVHMSLWSQEDVSAWLRHVGLAELVPPFKAAHIDGPTLLNLTPRDLQQMGLTVRSRVS